MPFRFTFTSGNEGRVCRPFYHLWENTPRSAMMPSNHHARWRGIARGRWISCRKYMLRRSLPSAAASPDAPLPPDQVQLVRLQKRPAGRISSSIEASRRCSHDGNCETPSKSSGHASPLPRIQHVLSSVSARASCARGDGLAGSSKPIRPVVRDNDSRMQGPLLALASDD